MILDMNPRLLVLLIALAASPPLFSQLEDADTSTKATCVESMKTSLPAEAAQVSIPHSWPDCNSYKSYAGIGTKVDFQTARACAWSERLAQQANLEPRYTISSVFGGSAMLTVLYANGEGVKRNIPLALRFACEADGAPREIEGRLHSLEALEKTATAQQTKFSFCDDVTSGFMMGFCSAYSSEIGDQDRAHSLDKIASQFAPAQRVAFRTLVSRLKAYAEAHARGEIDLSGTARAMFQIDAEDSLLDDFDAALQAYEKGAGFPKSDHNSAAAADQQLNEAYRKALADAENHKSDYGAVQPEGIRNAERAWLKYRDAWLAFANSRYPTVPPEAWLTLLTKDRTSVIDGSFCDMDAEDGTCAQQGDTWKPKPLP